MHDNFEKKVQKKMEELHLTPSVPVWEKIEMEIRPEKNKRRVFFWLFFGLLLAGGAFVTYQFVNKQEPVAEQPLLPVTNQSTKNTDSKIEKSSEEPRSADIEKTTDKTKTSIAERKKPANSKQEIGNLTTYISQISKTIEKNATTERKIQPGKKENTEQKNQLITTDSKTKEELINQERTPTFSHAQNEVIKTADPLPETDKQKQQVDSLGKQPEEKTEKPKAVDSALKRKVAVNKGWRKQIQISAGRSDYMTAPSTKALSMDANAPSTVGSAAPIFYRPAETKGSLAFMASFSLAKKLNEHFEIGIGLQYAYYSTKTNVGNRLQNDTLLRYANSSFSAGSFYTNNATGYHTNRFHVAEIPVTVSYKPLVNLPLYISVSAAYGRLVATNALTFSNRNNVYFENKQAYVRNMLPISSSLQVELFNKKKTSLRLGPVVQYNLLKLQKEVSEGERHLFYAGFKSALIF